MRRRVLLLVTVPLLPLSFAGPAKATDHGHGQGGTAAGG
jgi:hypothetical protein